MSAPRPRQDRLLAASRLFLDEVTSSIDEPGFTRDNALHLEILEGAASLLGGFDLGSYWSLLSINAILDVKDAQMLGASLVEHLSEIPPHPALSLGYLAEPRIVHADRRRHGVYYTDHRLACYVARKATIGFRPGMKIVDPAVGTGSLLTATVIELSRVGVSTSRLLADSVFGADISSVSLRGTLLSLSSLTGSMEAIQSLCGHLRQHDSLLLGPDAWNDVAPDRFDCVIGNPPWERLKLTSHEFRAAHDTDWHYGREFAAGDMDDPELRRRRDSLAAYAQAISSRYELQGRGEVDLYKAFVELSVRLMFSRGRIVLLVPAGLIRAQGAAKLRRMLLDRAQLDIAVFSNRAGYFPIDSRFKFCVLDAEIGMASPGAISLHHEDTTRPETPATLGRATMPRETVHRLNDSFGVPEVHNQGEWELFERIYSTWPPLSSSEAGWNPHVVRELDMTLDRHLFRRTPAAGAIPLIEGRMIHQFRFGAKAYISGTGRRATWIVVPPGSSVLPQYWVLQEAIPQELQQRISQRRASFCDITGQTNERSLLAAEVPPGVVCGNKVPTITFEPSSAVDPVSAWVGVANSITIDWFLRRVVTTTVNMFLLRSLPFPPLQTPILRDVARLADCLRRVTADAQEGWTTALQRTEIEVLVLAESGLDARALRVMLRDFPLLDRAQPPLPGEKRSTVTSDLVLLHAHRAVGGLTVAQERRLEERVERARDLGAAPFVPGQNGLDNHARILTSAIA